MIMSLRNLFIRSDSVGSQHLVCDNQDSSCSIDFTLPDVGRFQCIRDLRKGNISSLKIFANDVDILTDNTSYLIESLVDLKIRPEPNEALSDEDEEETSFIQDPKIHRLPRALEILCNIQTLYLNSNGMYPSGLLKSVETLQNLERVTLCHCGIDDFSNSLSKKITYLNLAHNGLTRIPSSIFKLQFLQCLILTRNKISETDPEINKLKTLEKLDMSHNRLDNFPVSICELSTLLKLYLSGNKIRSLPDKVSMLPHLKQFDLSNNCLTSLPDSIGELIGLRLLNLNYNKLTAVPESICNLNIRDDALLLSGNPLYKPPVEVCIQGKDSIQGYFDAAKKSVSINCKRLKLVLLGESLAGKTSLARAMVEGKDAEVEEEQRTVGLDFYSWRPDPLENDLQLLIVDCAGQRKYLLTHQFFFSEGALFLLVVNLEEYKQTTECFMKMIGDWISLVIGQVPGAVILVVPTHLDKFSNRVSANKKCMHIVKNIKKQEKERVKALDAEIEQLDVDTNSHIIDKLLYLKRNRPYLTASFNAQDSDLLKDLTKQAGYHTYPETENGGLADSLCLIPVSCRGELEGLSNLKMEILRIIENKELCPILEKEIPESWMEFEQRIKLLANKKDNIPVVTVDTLAEVAEKEFNLTRNMTLSSLNYLNSIGSIAYFRTVEKAKHLVFLNQSWLVGMLQLLFRHDHEKNLVYKRKFTNFAVMDSQFDQDKDQLLCNGNLSRNLLRCIWDGIGHDVALIEQIVDILEHFSIICRLPCCDYNYFITWFLGDFMPPSAENAWSKYDATTEDQIVTRMDVGISVLPTSVFERFLIHVRANSTICAPWKTGFFAREYASKIRVLCSVKNGKNCSQIALHGRFSKGGAMEMWIILYNLWTQFQALISEWNGLVCRKTFSVCPKCIEEGIKKPYLFQINWQEINQTDPSVRECLQCLNFIDEILLKPNGDIIKELNGNTSATEILLTGPVTDLELSKVAEMIGSNYGKLALRLGLKQHHVDAATHNWPHDHYNTAMEILQKWKQMVEKDDRTILIQALKGLQPSTTAIIHMLASGSEAV